MKIQGLNIDLLNRNALFKKVKILHRSFLVPSKYSKWWAIDKNGRLHTFDERPYIWCVEYGDGDTDIEWESDGVFYFIGVVSDFGEWVECVGEI